MRIKLWHVFIWLYFNVYNRHWRHWHMVSIAILYILVDGVKGESRDAPNGFGVSVTIRYECTSCTINPIGGLAFGALLFIWRRTQGKFSWKYINKNIPNQVKREREKSKTQAVWVCGICKICNWTVIIIESIPFECFCWKSELISQIWPPSPSRPYMQCVLSK